LVIALQAFGIGIIAFVSGIMQGIWSCGRRATFPFLFASNWFCCLFRCK